MTVHAFILAAAPAGAASDSAEVGRLVSMLLVLALLGVILVGGVALTVAVRRARRLRAEAAQKHETVRTDAWAESARRMTDPPEIEPEVDPDAETRS